MVVGPTPPGTGVIRRATLEGLVEGDIADVALVVPGVDHHDAGPQPVPAHEAGSTHRGDHEVGRAHDDSEVTGVRVAVWSRWRCAAAAASTTGRPRIGLRPITTACRPAGSTR